MINESEIITMVRQMIRKEIVPTLMATLVANSDQFRSSMQRFSSEGTIGNLRNISPYGFASRPPSGTPVVVSAIGNDPSHLNIMGAFDQNRPTINDGESIIYGPDGNVIYMKSDGSIHQGVEAAASPVVLGDVLMNFLNQLINAFITQPNIQIGFDSIGGPVYLDPTIYTTLVELQEEFITNTSTNIVGQKNFVDRGA